MLGVSGAKSFSGFMVAAQGALRSLATPQPAAARAASGARGVCGSALPPAPAHGPRRPVPACLAPPPQASPKPSRGPRPSTLAPGHRTTLASSSHPAPIVLKGQRPCCWDHVTPQQLPSSASRTHPCGLATPPQDPTFLSSPIA